MSRNIIIDELRGIAFLLMIVHHVNYFKDVSTGYSTSYASTPIVNLCGTLSRNLFIFLVGFTMYEAYENKPFEKYAKKRVERSMLIGLHALIISLMTHHFFPNYGIKFGVLHFISLSTILSIGFVKVPKIAAIIAIVLIYLSNLNLSDFSLGQPIDLILGINSSYAMMDYFPLIKWLPVLLTGIFVGYVNKNPNDRLIDNFEFFEFLGKHSLNLYTFHLILLTLYYTKN